MDKISAGVLADAHRVARLVGGRYLSWPKDVARRRIIKGLRQVEPDLVLDLWGGGTSAKALVAEGFAVLSVDDGRSFDVFGVTAERGKRAMQVCANESGYLGRWADAVSVASEADAAFLDFMGHWSPEVKRTLMACRHMKVVAVTLMPERTPIGRLDEQDWLVAYQALIESALRMKVRWTYVYRRNDRNQRATVFLLRPHSRHAKDKSPCIDCGASLQGMPGQTKRCAECRRYRESHRLRGGLTSTEYGRRYAPQQKEYDRVRKTPEYRAEMARRQRERYASDPEYREMKKRYARDGRDVGVERTCCCGKVFRVVTNARYCSDDCRTQARRDRHAAWQRSDAGRAWGVANRARKKMAAVSGTATEAISRELAA